MLKPRWRKVLADFWENKARSVLVIASIFIGVFAVGLILTSNEILPSSLLKVYSEAVPANITVETSPFGQALIDRVENINTVDSLSARKTVIARAKTTDMTHWKSLSIQIVNDIEDLSLKKLELIEGRLPSSKNEIVLLKQATNDFDLHPGDQLEIKLMDETIQIVEVVGIVNDYSAGIEITTDPRIAYANDKASLFLHSGEGFTTLHISVTGDKKDLDHINITAEEIKSAIEDSGITISKLSIQGNDQHPYSNYIEAVTMIFASMGILLVGLSSFLIINVLNSLMSQHTRQIGVMKLIGAQTKDVVTMYLSLVALFGSIAFLIGVPISTYAAYMMDAHIAELLNGYLTVSTKFTLAPRVILVQAIIAFLVPMGTSLIPILRGAGVSVSQALNTMLIKHEEKITWFDRKLKQLKGVYGILLLSIRNTFRNKGRLALTLFTLSMGGAIFIAVFNVQSVLDEHIDTVAKYSAADVFVTFSREYQEEEVKQLALTIPGVKTVEGWDVMNAKLETGNQTENVYIEAPPDGSTLLNPEIHSGRWVSEDDYFTIVVNEDFARTMPDLKEGDSLTLTIDGQDYSFEVVGFFNYTGLQDKRAYMNESTVTLIQGNRSKSRSFRIVTEEHTLSTQNQMEKELADFFNERGYHIARTSSIKTIINEAGEKINIVIDVLLILAILTGVVGSIGLSGTLSLNVLERTSEIGILRAVGAHDTVVSKLVLYEGGFIGITSYLIGVVFSFPISLVLGNIVNMAIFSATAHLIINPTGFILWFVLISIMSFLASLLPVRNATRLTIREVLAYE